MAAAADPPVGGQDLCAAVLGGGRAATHPPADEDGALLAEERAGGRYPPVGGYPPDGGGCRSRGPRRRWAERPLRQHAVGTSATAATAPMAAILDSFLLLARSYVRSQATPVVLTRGVVRDLSTYHSSCENIFSFRKSRVYFRKRAFRRLFSIAAQLQGRVCSRPRFQLWNYLCVCRSRVGPDRECGGGRSVPWRHAQPRPHRPSPSRG